MVKSCCSAAARAKRRLVNRRDSANAGESPPDRQQPISGPADRAAPRRGPARAERKKAGDSPPSARGLSPPGVEERRPKPRQMRRAPPSGTRGGRSAAPGARAGGPPQAGPREAGGAEATAPAQRSRARPQPSGGGGEARRSDGRARQPRSGLPRASIPLKLPASGAAGNSRGGWPTGAPAPGVPGARPGTVQLRLSEEIPRGEGRSGPWRGGTTTLLSPLVVVGHWSKVPIDRRQKEGLTTSAPPVRLVADGSSANCYHRYNAR